MAKEREVIYLVCAYNRGDKSQRTLRAYFDFYKATDAVRWFLTQSIENATSYYIETLDIEDADHVEQHT